MYLTPFTENTILGLIWENLSSTPVTPKSGEALLQIAPTLTQASMASTARAQLGMYPTILSPLCTPLDLRAETIRATLHFSSEKVIFLVSCPSPIRDNYFIIQVYVI